MMTPFVSMIIVTYNNEETIRSCLMSCQREKREEDLEIIVSDNASSDETRAIVQSYPGISLIARSRNDGFAQGANRGANDARGKYLCFLNPDAELQPGAIRQLIDRIEQDFNIGEVGGKFISSHGKALVSFGNFPSLITECLTRTRLGKFVPLSRYVVPSMFSRRLFKKEHDVDWVSGGFCLVRKDIFDLVGGFDPNYFLYLEDIDLSRRIWEKGFRVRFCPDAVAIHRQHRSNTRDAKRHERESLRYYFTKFR